MLSTMRKLGKWDELADALRDELAEYGGLLSLLDEQRDAIMQRRVDALMDVNAKVQEQALSAEHYRDVREEVCARFAKSIGCGASVTVMELVKKLPVEVQGMFTALVEDGIGVTNSAKKKVERNSQLLSRAGDLNERLLIAVRPQSTTKTYNKRGNVYLKTEKTVGGLDISA
jgi:hypothetical protein